MENRAVQHCLSVSLLTLAIAAAFAAEPAPAFPLWDGVEPIADYAKRVNLPPTKTLDLGNNVTLDLVLIPAGKFIMGSPEPAKPAATVARSEALMAAGIALTLPLILAMIFKTVWTRKFSFSLRWLLAVTISSGLMVGGIARWHLARQQAERYAAEMTVYNQLPANEKPGHLVTLTRPFYMSKHPVTHAQYLAMSEYDWDEYAWTPVKEGFSDFRKRNPVNGITLKQFLDAKLPIERVSWTDAMEFCKRLNNRLKNQALEASLPTEAQWEFACRAGTKTQYYSGDMESDLDAVAWYDKNSDDVPHPVGAKKPNSFGLYDMHGNVWQWCRDSYIDRFDNNPEVDPLHDSGVNRVLRGGSFGDNFRDCRAVVRGGRYPDGRNQTFGFRIVITLYRTH